MDTCIDLLLKFKDGLKSLNNKYLLEYVDYCIEKVKRDKLEVAFVGEVSTGKSTLINALLGKDLLPIGIGATTLKLAYIKKDNIDAVTVHYKDDSVKVFGVKKDIIEKISKDENVENFEISLKDFPFERITFVDTIGVGDIENMEQITYTYLPLADAIVLVVDVAKLLTSQQKELLETAEAYKSKIFIVFNKMDMVLDEYTNLEALKEEISADTKQILTIYKNWHVISARWALEGFLLKNEEKIQKSNIEDFKHELFSYLSNCDAEKATKERVKNWIQNIKEVAVNQLTETKEILEISLEEFERKKLEIKEQKKKFEEEKIKVEEMLRNIENCVSDAFEKLEKAIMKKTWLNDINEEIQKFKRNIQSCSERFRISISIERQWVIKILQIIETIAQIIRLILPIFKSGKVGKKFPLIQIIQKLPKKWKIFISVLTLIAKKIKEPILKKELEKFLHLAKTEIFNQLEEIKEDYFKQQLAEIEGKKIALEFRERQIKMDEEERRKQKEEIEERINTILALYGKIEQALST